MKKEELKHLAKLSRIKLTDEELDKFTPQMQTILNSVKTLDELDVSKVKVRSLRKVKLSDLREDKVGRSLSQKEALANAPFTQDGSVKVFGSLIEV
jgi:aspartyl-tRNA(Asn)/glutamyl-tRNA(Gln) amidotransferase subunit C